MEKNKIIKTLEIIPGYLCNSGCIFCSISENFRKINLNTEDIMNKIKYTKDKYNPNTITFGGGEPTIRKDLIEIIKYSKYLNFSNIELKSNGFMFYYKDKVEEYINEGVNTFHITFHGIDNNIYSKLTQIKNSLNFVLKGIENILSFNKTILIDMTVNRFNINLIKDSIIYLNNLGIVNFKLWLLINEGRSLKYGKSIIMSMKEIKSIFIDLFEYSKNNNFVIKSLFTPYCIFPKHKENIFNPNDEGILMITPHSEFNLEKSSLDFGEKVFKCNNCLEYNHCFGIHKNYIKLYGIDEFNAII